MILTKKRYMSIACYRDGVLEKEIKKKGVLLARRDTAGVVRNIYSWLIKKIFHRVKLEDILYYIVDSINKFCSYGVPLDDFTITKSVGDTNDEKCKPFIDEKDNKKKIMIGDYKVPILPTEEKAREHKFNLKGIENKDEKVYYRRCLPAQVQLALRMGRRGQPVAPGSRIEYNITKRVSHSENQWQKIEEVGYFKEHRELMRIDPLSYIKLMSNPVDEVLNCIYYRDDEWTEEEKKQKKSTSKKVVWLEELKRKLRLKRNLGEKKIEKKEEKKRGREEKKEGKKYKFWKDFVLDQYKYRLRVREKVLEDIRSLSEPKIVLLDDKGNPPPGKGRKKTSQSKITDFTGGGEEREEREEEINLNVKPKSSREMLQQNHNVYVEAMALKIGVRI